MADDPREKMLIDAMRKLDYDPHFADVREREIGETKLFLARMDALAEFYRSVVAYKINDSGELQPIYESFHQRSMSHLFPGAILEPIPMILFCPKCCMQHVDAAKPHKPDCGIRLAVPLHCSCDAWQNPPHRSHLCAYCGHIWRPADVPTAGVQEISTMGRNDTPNPIRGREGMRG